MMNNAIEEFVPLCFPQPGMPFIAANILREEPESGVSSLRLLAVKSVMKRKMKKDTRSKVFFSLMFRVPMDIYQFADAVGNPFCRGADVIAIGVQQKLTSDPKWQVLRQFRMNPLIMYHILEQNLPKRGRLVIVIGKFTLRIQLNSYELVDIKHRNGEIYDTYWATKFAQVVLRKGVSVVSFKTENQEMHIMEDIIDGLIGSLQPTIPSEGWQAAVENGTHRIYQRNLDQTDYVTLTYAAQFAVASKYALGSDYTYWGYFD